MKRFIENIVEPSLKPCPFCNNPPARSTGDAKGIIIQVYEVSIFGTDPVREAVVKCGNCLAKISRATPEYAIKAWNTRIQEDLT